MTKKSNMSPWQRKALASSVAAALLTGGIGASIRRSRDRKEREKSTDIESMKNAIIIPLRKDKFLEGLPTPDEFAKAKGDVSSDGGTAATAVPENPAELEALKRKILQKKARAIDFFAKSSEEQKDDNAAGLVAAKDEGGKAPEVAGDKKKDDKSDMPRDELGRFVSPTDPVGVASAEKTAANPVGFVADTVEAGMHPFGALSGALTYMKDNAMPFALGASGAIVLAAKIVDAVNRRRADKAKKETDKARYEYAKLLQSGGEKTAQINADKNNAVKAMGWLASAFGIPFVFSAMIANRVMEKRKEDKELAKEKSDSFPEPTYMYYKTAEAQEIRMTPETALALIMVKTAMFEFVEEAERSTVIEKDAAFGAWSVEDATKAAIEAIKKEENAGYLLDLVKHMHDNKGDISGAKDIFAKMLGSQATLHSRAFNNPEVWKAVVSSKDVSDTIADRFANKKYADTWGAYGDELMEEGIAKRWGLKAGGWLHRFISWLAKITGLGRGMVVDGVKGTMSDISSSLGKLDANPKVKPKAAPVNVAAQARRIGPAVGGTESWKGVPTQLTLLRGWNNPDEWMGYVSLKPGEPVPTLAKTVAKPQKLKVNPRFTHLK